MIRKIKEVMAILNFCPPNIILKRFSVLLKQKWHFSRLSRSNQYMKIWEKALKNLKKKVGYLPFFAYFSVMAIFATMKKISIFFHRLNKSPETDAKSGLIIKK